MIESSGINPGKNQMRNQAGEFKQASPQEPMTPEKMNHSSSETPMAQGNSNPLDHPKNEAQPENSSATSSSASSELLKKRIEELEAQVKEKENKYVYLYADFENFKKRSIKERSDLVKFGWEPVARDLVQNIDDLERALAHVPSATDKNLHEGLKMVLNQLKSSLHKQGIQTIESLEKPFDPNFHEAVGQEESDLPSGVIIKEHTRGYTLHGRLLRPSRVVISRGRSTETQDS